ncbi:ankyrin repeat domain-containing protein 40 [Protopterus annectens]|uniref:ankyrin repeat domain-containing protein 40 n=1 Tax=Protopterus annectens TaxID=7888 RepID=UPI001CFB5580|nr:ankyrin repeat domain-containing protein 40 [Protopterus annectens]
MTDSYELMELQESLREAAAIGDLEEVRNLVEKGADVNSQNLINGWTCLHWACKRNHPNIVSYLLDVGADKEILTVKGEKAVQLTSKPDVRKILGVQEDELIDEKKPTELPIIPNYISNTSFPFVKDKSASADTNDISAARNGVNHLSTDTSSSEMTQDKNTHSHTPSRKENAAEQVCNGTVANRVPPLSGTEYKLSGHQTGPIYPRPVTQSASLCSPITSNPMSQQQNGISMGSLPAFQPFFFTGAFPVSMQELVLKVRVENPSVKDNDFIEIELDRQELTYQTLLTTCCKELGTRPEEVSKIRKLPNTLLRKDRDVARLQDFQELEVVLLKNDNLPLLSSTLQGPLTERPCFNATASKLTY